MELLPLSFLAGVLTILAPCMLPLLPVIIGGSAATAEGKWHKWRPLIITGSLMASIVVFTLLLKLSTAFIGLGEQTLKVASGIIILVLGLAMLFPFTWQKLMVKIGVTGSSEELLQKSAQSGTLGGAVMTGVAMGPVFSSCSPTYGIIIATVFPQSFTVGLLNLFVYVLGLGVVMLLIAWLGHKLVKKLRWAVNPNGWFRRVLAVLFILIGVAIIFGGDKWLEEQLLQLPFYENLILQELELVEAL